MLFPDVKVGSILLYQSRGVRFLATVQSICTLLLDGQNVFVAVSRGGVKFRLDAGLALPPVQAWVVRRVTSKEALRVRATWGYQERDV